MEIKPINNWEKTEVEDCLIAFMKDYKQIIIEKSNFGYAICYRDINRKKKQTFALDCDKDGLKEIVKELMKISPRFSIKNNLMGFNTDKLNTLIEKQILDY